MEYIEREALRDEILNDPTFDNDTINYYLGVVDLQPSADVVEVVHGKWINIICYGDYCLGYCSVCWTLQGATFPSALKEGFRYCRWCGAKMDGGKE